MTMSRYRRYRTSVQKRELLLLDDGALTTTLRQLLSLLPLLLLRTGNGDDELLDSCLGGGTGSGSGWGCGDTACPLHFAHPQGAGAQQPQFGG